MLDFFKKSKDIFLGLILFIFTFFVYLSTLAPTITAEDSGELVTAAWSLGLAHPPGFTLYVILGKFFTLIPFSSMAWRVNLMSAFFGSLTVVLLFYLIVQVTKNRLIGFFSGLILAFSAIFWSQSIIAEVYTLNSFFVVLLFLILIRWSEDKSFKYLLLFCFVYGLSLTNHTMMVLFSPAYTLYILLVDRKIITKPTSVIFMFSSFCLGLSLYLVFLVRSSQAEFMWTEINNLSDLWNHVSRKQYSDFAPLEHLFGKIGLVISFFVDIARQFFWPTLVLSLGGLTYLFKKKPALAVLTFGVFFCNSILIIFLRKFGWGLGVDYIYRVYYLPSYLIVVFWFAILLDFIYLRIIKDFSIKYKKILLSLIVLLLILVPTSLLVSNYKQNDLSSLWFNYDYFKNVLLSLEENSVYYFAYDGSLHSDTELFALLYLKKVEGLRPDVAIVSEHQFFYKEAFLTLPEEHYSLDFEEKRRGILDLLSTVLKDKAVYTNFGVAGDMTDTGVFSLSDGLTHKLYLSTQEAKKGEVIRNTLPIRNIEEERLKFSYTESGLLAHHYYTLAYFYLTQDESEKSQEYLIKAFNLDQMPFGHEYKEFIKYRKEWKKEEDLDS